MTLRSEIKETLRRLLKDDNVILIGESVADPFGGANKVTRGLKGNIIDMPICEQAQVGWAIGAAMTGKTVILEIMFANFLSLCVSQLKDIGEVLGEHHGIKFKVIIRAVTNDNPLYGPNHSGNMRWLLEALGFPIFYAKKGDVDRVFDSAIGNEHNINLIIEEKTNYVR